MSFYKLGIKSDLVYALELQKIYAPTPIQTLSIPQILAKKDLIAEAQTGTGKTLAFLLPLFQILDLNSNSIQALIIAPTRELAIQITKVANDLANIKHFNILSVYGGQDVNAQIHKLNGNIQIVIGTPGRILDHIRRKSINFNELKTLIIDEADQMFHIGFQEELQNILDVLPAQRQTLCFSATIDNKLDTFSETHLINPIFVQAPKKQIIIENIKQIVVETSNRKKYDDFLKILNQNFPNKAIIFCRSRRGTHDLYEELLKSGFNVEELHGGLTQSKREFVMNAFRNNSIKFLVATDVAARGLDVDGVTHVFNYNLPDDIENYVHRIGRTGRAGFLGIAYTMLTAKDSKRLESIEKFINMKIDRISFHEEKNATNNTKKNKTECNTKKSNNKAIIDTKYKSKNNTKTKSKNNLSNNSMKYKKSKFKKNQNKKR